LLFKRKDLYFVLGKGWMKMNKDEISE